MSNNILFYSPVGNVGKSTIAYTFFDYQKREGVHYEYHTNDPDNVVFDMDKLIPNNYKIIEHGKEIHVDDEINTIFDFGGYLDSRVVDVAGYVDTIVIVITYMSQKEVSTVTKMINTLLQYNKNIVLLLNNTQTDKRAEGEAIFKATLNEIETKIPLFVVNKSNYFVRLANFNMSLYDICDTDRTAKGQLKKNIFPSLHKLFDYIK